MELQNLSSMLDASIVAFYGPGLLLLMYFFAVWDSRRADSPSHGDTQVGLKVALHVFLILGVLIAASGVQSIVGFILGQIKVKASSQMIREGVGQVLAGGAAAFVVYSMLLPRTNYKEFDRISRMSLGVVAALSGIVAIASFSNFLGNFIGGVSWAGNFMLLSASLVFGGLGFVAVGKFGAASGWTAPPPRQTGFGDPGAGGGYQQPQGYPPQGQGYPPQGQGYPPGQGAPPQGGGYPPPQGGGFPPAGGGVPPAGGGYPPSGGQGGQGGQGGGGLPPPGGSFPPGGGQGGGGGHGQY